MNGAGIMNLPTNVGGMASQDGLDSFAPLIASQQAARDIGYPQFTRELLSAGSEVDPAEVQEFLQAIREARLSPDEIATMRRVVENVLNDPNNYPQVRMRLLQEGVPEDLLPETFDLEFFMAMRIAVEEAENISRESRPMGPQMPMEMAEGGIVGLPQMQPIARELAAMGRNGDTMLAHITPEEAMLLQRMGGSGTINPYTGLPEFFLKKLGRALKKFAKSTVGRIVISVALGAFLGPAVAGFVGVSSAAGVAAISGAVGGFGSSILAGDGLKAAIRNGITAAATAGIVSGITGGAEAFAARPELTAAYQQQGFTGTIRDTAKGYFGSPTDTAKQMYGTERPVTPAVEATPSLSPSSVSSVPTAQELMQVGPTPPPTSPVLGGPSPGMPADFTRMGPPAPAGAPPVSTPISSSVPYEVMPNAVDAAQQARAVAAAQATPTPAISLEPSFSERFPRLSNVYENYLSPSRASIQGRSANTIFDDLVTTKGLPRTADTMKLAEQMAVKEAPGVIAKYGPLAATGALALEATTGGISNLFQPVEGEGGVTFEEYNRQRAEEAARFREQRPEFFGGFVRGAFDRMPYTAAKGSGPEGVTNFPRKTGAINGPGTGTSDSIPAMLSDGEFVFTAKSVRNMGGGSRRKGAAKMYRLMKMLEGGPVGKGR